MYPHRLVCAWLHPPRPKEKKPISLTCLSGSSQIDSQGLQNRPQCYWWRVGWLVCNLAFLAQPKRRPCWFAQSKRGVSCVTQECSCDFNFTVLNKSTANKRHTDIPDVRRAVPCFSSNLLMLPLLCCFEKTRARHHPMETFRLSGISGDLGLVTPRIVYVCRLCKSDKCFSS